MMEMSNYLLPFTAYFETLSHKDFVRLLQPYMRPIEVYRPTVLAFMHYVLSMSQHQALRSNFEWRRWILEQATIFCKSSGEQIKQRMAVFAMQDMLKMQSAQGAKPVYLSNAIGMVIFADYYFRHTEQDFMRLLLPHFSPWYVTQKVCKQFDSFLIMQGKKSARKSVSEWSQWMFRSAQQFGLEYRKAKFLEYQQGK